MHKSQRLKKLASALLMVSVASSLLHSTVAEETPFFRIQIPSPIMFSSSGSGSVEAPFLQAGNHVVRAGAPITPIPVRIDRMPNGATVALNGLPQGLTFDQGSMLISGTPFSGYGAVTPVPVSLDGKALGNLSIQVHPALQIDNINSSYELATGASLLIEPQPVGVVGNASWTISEAMPTGFSFDNSIPKISGSSGSATSFSRTLTLTDSFDGSPRHFPFSVSVVAPLTPLTVAGIASTLTARTGTSWFSPAPEVTGGAGPFTYSLLSSTNLQPVADPTGTTFSSSTGQLTGTFATARGWGPYVIRATNAAGQSGDTDPFTITVENPPPAASGGSPSYTSGVANNTAWRQGIIDFGQVVRSTSIRGSILVNPSSLTKASGTVEYFVSTGSSNGPWEPVISKRSFSSASSRSLPYNLSWPAVEGRYFKIYITGTSSGNTVSGVGIESPVYN